MKLLRAQRGLHPHPCIYQIENIMAPKYQWYISQVWWGWYVISSEELFLHLPEWNEKGYGKREEVDEGKVVRGKVCNAAVCVQTNLQDIDKSWHKWVFVYTPFNENLVEFIGTCRQCCGYECQNNWVERWLVGVKNLQNKKGTNKVRVNVSHGMYNIPPGRYTRFQVYICNVCVYSPIYNWCYQ